MKLTEISQLPNLVGTKIGESEWLTIDQQRVNSFADATNDHQFIHVDPEAAAKTPFGGPIAHGFLTLSLLSYLQPSEQIMLPNLIMGVNYGFDKVRFMAPVPVGSRIRAHYTLSEFSERGAGKYLFNYKVSVEIEGQKKAALSAQWLTLMVVKN